MRPAALALWLAGCSGRGAGPDSGELAPDSGAAAGGVAGAHGSAPERFTGQELYLAQCVYCHGSDARGTADGPDLQPVLAASASGALVPVVQGGRGDMPLQPLTAAEVVRALEHARGLVGLR